MMDPPNGLRQRGSSGGGGSGVVHQTFRLQGSMDVGDIDEHYGRELVDTGWIRLSHSTPEGMAFSGWRFIDRLGDPWSATLMVGREVDGADFTQAAIQAILLREP